MFIGWCWGCCVKQMHVFSLVSVQWDYSGACFCWTNSCTSWTYCKPRWIPPWSLWSPYLRENIWQKLQARKTGSSRWGPVKRTISQMLIIWSINFGHCILMWRYQPHHPTNIYSSSSKVHLVFLSLLNSKFSCPIMCIAITILASISINTSRWVLPVFTQPFFVYICSGSRFSEILRLGCQASDFNQW